MIPFLKDMMSNNPKYKNLNDKQLKQKLYEDFIIDEQMKLLRLQNGITNNDDKYVLYFLNNTLVGFALFYQIDNAYEISELYTNIMRKGIGTDILDYIFKEAYKRNIDEIYIQALLENNDAYKMYEKFGFTKINGSIYHHNYIYKIKDYFINKTI